MGDLTDSQRRFLRSYGEYRLLQAHGMGEHEAFFRAVTYFYAPDKLPDPDIYVERGVAVMLRDFEIKKAP